MDRGKKLKTLLSFAAFGFVGITITLMILSRIKPKEEPLTFTVSRRDISVTEGAKGEVGFDVAVCVPAPESLTIVDIPVSLGDTVKKGDELFSIDTSELSKKVAEYEKLYSDAESIKNMSDEYLSKSTELSEQVRTYALKLAKEEYETALKEKEALDSRIAEYNVALSRYEQQRSSVYQELMQMEVPQEISEAEDGNDEEKTVTSTEDENRYIRLKSTYDVLDERCTTYSSLISETKEEAAEKDDEIEELKYSLDSAASEENGELEATFDESLLKSYRSKIDELKKQIDNAVYYSPINGIVTDITLEKGSPGYSGAAVTISDAGSKLLKLSLSPEKRKAVGEGMKVLISSDSTGADVIDGIVSSVSDVCVNDKYAVEVRVSNEDLDRFLGKASFFARIIISERKNVLAVPYESIESSDGKHYVYIKEGKHALKKEISIGLETDYYTEVSGIDEDSVIYLSFRDGKANFRGSDK